MEYFEGNCFKGVSFPYAPGWDAGATGNCHGGGYELPYPPLNPFGHPDLLFCRGKKLWDSDKEHGQQRQ